MFTASSLNTLEKQFLKSWLTPEIDDQMLDFVILRMQPEALELIHDKELRQRAKCRQAFLAKGQRPPSSPEQRGKK